MLHEFRFNSFKAVRIPRLNGSHADAEVSIRSFPAQHAAGGCSLALVVEAVADYMEHNPAGPGVETPAFA